MASVHSEEAIHPWGHQQLTSAGESVAVAPTSRALARENRPASFALGSRPSLTR